MIQIKRTNSKDKAFVSLVKDLDAYLKVMDGEEHSFYNQFNGIAVLDQVVVAYEGDVPIGCGAIKKYDSSSMEVKRMFVLPQHRGKGIAKKILEALERWSFELGYKKCVLETGKRQKEAVLLYKAANYVKTPNYGPYVQMENSICFEKELNEF